MNQVLSLFLDKRQLTYADYEKLMNPQITDMHDASRLKDSRTFIDLLHNNRNERITIVPDYDADGVNSGIVLKAGLSLIGLTHEPYLYCPTTHLGYGLTKASVDDVLLQSPETTLILTADNGIKAFDGVAYAKSLGLKVFVTDHHLGGDTEPNADVIVNPNRLTDTYPFKSISGTEVAWKLMVYYAQTYGDERMVSLMLALGVFAGISVVSDVMEVLDENRFILQSSLSMCQNRSLLRELSQEPQPQAYRAAFRGLLSLLAVLETNDKLKYGLDEDTFGFYLSPMLNSPRRMHGTSKASFDVFVSSNETEALNSAYELFELNESRKAIVKSVNESIDRHIDELESSFCPVVAINARMGFAGLVAGHVTNRYGFPHITFAKGHDDGELLLSPADLTLSGGVIHGSGRSPAGFDLFGTVSRIQQQAPYIFSTFGGHEQAIGLGIFAEHYGLFEELFSNEVLMWLSDVQCDDVGDNRGINPEHISISSDELSEGDLTIGQSFSLSDLCDGLQLLDKMKPYGEGFRQQVFVTDVSMVSVSKRFLGASKQHARLELPNGLVAMSWNNADQIDRLSGVVRFIGTMQVNEFRGNRTPQLIVDVATPIG